jgi:hypothetical protein
MGSTHNSLKRIKSWKNVNNSVNLQQSKHLVLQGLVKITILKMIFANFKLQLISSEINFINRVWRLQWKMSYLWTILKSVITSTQQATTTRKHFRETEKTHSMPQFIKCSIHSLIFTAVHQNNRQAHPGDMATTYARGWLIMMCLQTHSQEDLKHRQAIL